MTSNPKDWKAKDVDHVDPVLKYFGRSFWNQGHSWLLSNKDKQEEVTEVEIIVHKSSLDADSRMFTFRTKERAIIVELKESELRSILDKS